MKTREEILKKINEINYRVEFMKRYLQLKFDMQDWHGVEDAGSDIRDLEAEKKALLWVIDTI